MASLTDHKVVSALPGTLEANSVYYVRVGTGVEIYVTNNGGTIVSYATQKKGFSGVCAGKPSASELVAGGKAPYNYNITQANCAAEARVAATAQTVFIIKKNNVQVGTITFNAGSSVGTFSISTPAVAENNFMEVRAPASPDATLADITFLVRE